MQLLARKLCIIFICTVIFLGYHNFSFARLITTDLENKTTRQPLPIPSTRPNIQIKHVEKNSDGEIERITVLPESVLKYNTKGVSAELNASINDARFEDDYDDLFEDDFETIQEIDIISDPIEPWNRFWFGFNNVFYMHIAKPLYTGYDYITPDPIQKGIANVFHNVLFPIRFVNNLLQGKFQAAGVEFSRFIVNSTAGIGGIFDLTTGRKTVVPVDRYGEDFGQTLGAWGIGEGFYIIWPFFGPSNLRDSVGRFGDWAIDPINYVHPWSLSAGLDAGFHFNELGDVLPMYEEIKKMSVDPYVGMREAYAAFRQSMVKR